MVGLRERNRQRTRRELAVVALRLFDEHGFDDVTVDRIAEEAGVSRSTFFRYFPTKEHVVFPDHQQDLAAYRAALTGPPTQGQPPQEAILAAASEAARATVDAFRRDPDLYRCRQRVIAATSSVRELGLRLDRDWEDALAEAFEHHLPRGLTTQVRILAGSLMGGVGAAHRVWASDGFRQDPADYEAAVMALFEHGLTGVMRDAR